MKSFLTRLHHWLLAVTALVWYEFHASDRPFQLKICIRAIFSLRYQQIPWGGRMTVLATMYWAARMKRAPPNWNILTISASKESLLSHRKTKECRPFALLGASGESLCNFSWDVISGDVGLQNVRRRVAEHTLPPSCTVGWDGHS